MSLPFIRGEGRRAEMIVDGRPFTALGGEIHNSSSSSLEYMDAAVWPIVGKMNMNSIVLPVYWECIEPEEGVYDFELLDGIAGRAREDGIKLILLWFGLWKNSESMYVPQWVKLDRERFPYMRTNGVREGDSFFVKGNTVLESISPLCNDAVKADASAFRAMMRHIREIDPEGKTIIAVQVENEIGVLGAARDYSPLAEEAFQKEIPENVSAAYGVSGTWKDAFKEEAEELFMAYYFGSAVEEIAAAGYEEHKIIYYVNAWLEQYPRRAGQYPSGGPVAKVIKMWKLVAPTIAFYAPDIYVDEFRDVCAEYAAHGNPLFIPEVRASKDTPSFALYAVGEYNALCFSPFGIEDLLQGFDGLTAEELKALNIDPSAMGGNRVKAGRSLSDAYKLLNEMGDLIRAAHQEGRIKGYLQYHDKGTMLSFKDFTLQVKFGAGGLPFGGPADEKDAPVGGGFVISLPDNEFILAGVSSSIVFYSNKAKNVGILRKEEGRFENGQWKRGRILNGDERMFHRFGENAGVLKIKVYEY